MNGWTIFAIVLASVVALIALVTIAFVVYRKNLSKGKTQGASARDVVVARKLHVPWSFSFLPDGNLLTTQRNGILSIIDLSGKELHRITVPNVIERGEGGLLGLALDPLFSQNNQIYLYYTTSAGAGAVKNRVSRFTLNLDANRVQQEKLLIDNIPGGKNHNGGRIRISPTDGRLFVTAGDAEMPDQAQNVNSLAGKILRINFDGTIPSDNPFGAQNPVYSYGHRNPQGIAWDSTGRIWETEHGRSVPLSGYDEVNLIEKGANYGWPHFQGDQTGINVVPPVLQSTAATTWAPGDVAVRNNSLFFTGLKGEALYEAKINSDGTLAPLETHLKNAYGRLRGLLVDDRGNLYVSTSNTDGRGNAREDDDKIIKLAI